MWIWIVVAVVAVIAIVVVIVMVKRKKKSPKPVMDDSTPGFANIKNHFEETSEKLDEEIQGAKKKIGELAEQAATVQDERKKDHENISGATDWDDLNQLAEDIESRR